jgi:hypothetical protein
MQYERAAKIAEIYKLQTDKLNDLYDKHDRMLSRFNFEIINI